MSPEPRTQFNVAQLLKELIGGTRAYDVVVPVSYEDAELANAKPLVGHLTMLRTIVAFSSRAHWTGLSS